MHGKRSGKCYAKDWVAVQELKLNYEKGNPNISHVPISMAAAKLP